MSNEDWKEGQEFYELMQAYRHAPLSDQKQVVEAFNNVKKYIDHLHHQQLQEKETQLVKEINELQTWLAWDGDYEIDDPNAESVWVVRKEDVLELLSKYSPKKGDL